MPVRVARGGSGGSIEPPSLGVVYFNITTIVNDIHSQSTHTIGLLDEWLATYVNCYIPPNQHQTAAICRNPACINIKAGKECPQIPLDQHLHLATKKNPPSSWSGYGPGYVYACKLYFN
jgi:hypothetical protein